MHHIVYKTTNLTNGRFYIGVHSTDNLADGYLGSGTLIRRAIDKYGSENFSREILCEVDSREEALVREEELITDALIADRNCYNLRSGGTGGWDYVNTYCLTSDRRSKSGADNPMFGRKQTDDTRKKISESKLGKKLGAQKEEHVRRKRSTKLLTFKVVSPEGEEFIVNDLPLFCSERNIRYKTISKLARNDNNLCTRGDCKGWSCRKLQ